MRQWKSCQAWWWFCVLTKDSVWKLTKFENKETNKYSGWTYIHLYSLSLKIYLLQFSRWRLKANKIFSTHNAHTYTSEPDNDENAFGLQYHNLSRDGVHTSANYFNSNKSAHTDKHLGLKGNEKGRERICGIRYDNKTNMCTLNFNFREKSYCEANWNETLKAHFPVQWYTLSCDLIGISNILN